MGLRHHRAVFCAVTALVACVLACGSRTSLDADLSSIVEPHLDAAPDLDAPTPVIDATAPADASVCPQNGLTAFLLSDGAELFMFDPPTLTTKPLGKLHCPTHEKPWSLTAASSGLIYAVYEDWNIYEIDPRTLDCTATAYLTNQLGLSTGTGITVAPTPQGERLFVYGQDQQSESELDVGDFTSFVLSNVGTVNPAPIASSYPLDIRADAFGRIFGLGPDGTLVQIDQRDARLLAQDQTSFSPMGGASWALLTWNDDLYFFSEGAASQYDLSTKTVTPKGDVGFTVVGASAAPCIH